MKYALANGDKLKSELKLFMDKHAEAVFPKTFVKFQCLEKERTLEDLGGIILKILRYSFIIR